MAGKKTTKKVTRKTSKKSTKKTAKKETAVAVAEERQPSVNLTPRQALFMQLYYDRESPTWGNAKQSAIAAGFSENIACQITYRRPKWWLDSVRQDEVASLVEQHIVEVLNMPNVTQAMGPFGPIMKTETIVEDTGEVYKTGKKKGQPKTRKKKIKVPILVRDVSMIKEKTAVAKLAAPAYDEKYKKAASNNNFIFNMVSDREKFAWDTETT